MDLSVVCGRFVNKVEELYRIDKNHVLGRGKYGTVYRGYCQSTGQQYAIKVIKKIRQDRTDVRRECNIFRKIHQNPHPNIANLVDWFETRREYFIVTELLEGGELFYFLQEREYLCEADAVAYIRQLLLALEHLHKQQICHLDLKPENIVLARDGSSTIKLVDFGSARDLSMEKKGSALTIVGTPEFVAPEVIAFNPITGAADMWSLGVVAYVILSGLSPFLGDTDQETLCNVTRSDYYFPEDDFPPVSQDAKDFIDALLVRNPRKRLTAEQALQHSWIQMHSSPSTDIHDPHFQPGNVRLSQLFISTDKLKNFNGRQKILAAFHVVRFAIKLRSFSRLHQLKHVTWDDGATSPPMQTAGSDEDAASSEVETCCSEEPQLNATLESCQGCFPVAEEGETEEEEEVEKEYKKVVEEVTEHTIQTVGSLERLALEESEVINAANSQVDCSMSVKQLTAEASPVCGLTELDIVSSCTAVAQHHLTCAQSGDGDARSPPAQQLEDGSGLGEPDSLASANSELVLGFSDLVHLMHECRCNGGVSSVSHYHERDLTVPTGVREHPCHAENTPLETDSDITEGNILAYNHEKQEMELFSEGWQPSECLSQEAALLTVDNDFNQGRELIEETEWGEEHTAHHSAQEQLISTEVEEVVLKGHPPAWETKGGTAVSEDTSAMPVMDAWVSPKIGDARSTGCDSSCGVLLSPTKDHQTNALVLESSGQTESSPTVSPSEMWRNESD